MYTLTNKGVPKQDIVLVFHIKSVYIGIIAFFSSLAFLASTLRENLRFMAV